MTGDIEVNLLGGTYALNSTLELTSNDSGSNGHRVIWQAAGSTAPVISGGQQITNWSLFDSTKNIYRASVGALRFRQLYVNRARAIRARAPNLTDSRTGGPYFQALNDTYPFNIQASEISNWQNLNQVEFIWQGNWRQKRARVENYTVNNGVATVNLLAPERNSILLNRDAQSPTPYYFENAYELLDAENEWYLNTSDEYLYYKPRAGQDMSALEVIAPKVEKLVTLTGSSGSPVRNIVFKGLTFSYDNWLLPNSLGFIDVQGSLAIDNGTGAPGGIGYTFLPGMVQVFNGEAIRFERNTFEKSGAHGLAFSETTRDAVVIGNTFRDTSASAINFWCQVGDPAIPCANNSISNNLVEDYGQGYAGSAGMFLERMSSTNIAHNEVRNGFYSGISLGWDFSDADIGANDNQVQYNKVHDVMRLLNDGGGIYTLGRMNNTRFHNNYIYGLSRSSYVGGSPVVGIFLDNGSSFKTVDFNVIDASTLDAFYAVNPPNRENVITNNFYSGSLGAISASNIVTNNIAGVTSQEAQNIINCAGIESVWGGSISSSCPSGSDPSTPPGTPGDSNLVLNKAVSISSGAGAVYLTDGSVSGGESTKWFAAGGNNSATVDLGTVQTVRRWVVKHAGSGGESAGYNTTSFRLQRSDDGVNWINADTVVGNSANLTDRAVTAFSARYVRLHVDQGNGGDGYIRIYELEVWGSSTPSDDSNLVLNKAVGISSGAGGVYLTDGSVSGGQSTKWFAFNGNESATVDLGTVQTVRRWVVKHAGSGGEGAGYNTTNFRLQRSDDGVSWTDADTVVGNTANVTDRAVSAFTARYIRLYVDQGSSGDGYIRIYELEVWGT